MAVAPTWESVYERNSVERIKRDRPPLGIRDELPALIAAGYERMPEEDIVRLQWWGLYHDKPKVGTFMLRIKLPSGILTPAKLRAIGEVSNRYGRGDGELSTRQCIQLHWLQLAELPNVFADLDAAGITTAGGCGDTVRNITGCPVAGLDADEVFDCSDLVAEAADFFYGNPDFTNLPRKHKYTIASCADRCNAPEINCVSLIGVLKDGREGFAVKVGGGLSSVPRIGRDLGVFVPREEAIEVLAAVTNVWSEDLRYRVSRVKARLKFMVDDVGADAMRCTGEPHCNFSVGETKTRLGRLVEHLEGVFGDAIADLRLHLDGCPHACAQHWVGDLGFQGTTGKDGDGRRLSAYDIFVRGSLAPEPEIARALFRRVPSERLEVAVEGLVRGWLDGRRDGEPFTEFQRRLSDEELGLLAGLEPARSRRDVEEETAA